jgi:Phytanoyl-CoA dioxygenase (PhyH)
VTQPPNAGGIAVDDRARLEDDLAEYGFAIVKGVISKAPLTELNSHLNAAYESAPKLKGGGSIVGHLNCFPGEAARFVYEEMVDRGIVDAVLAQREGQSTDILARVNWNLPGSSTQHFHMDSAFTNAWIVCNVAVVDITDLNGPMDVVPGSHRDFYPYWRFALERKARQSASLHMEQGDVLVRTSALWHRGTPNRSKAPRPLLSISFGEPTAQPGDPFELNGPDITFYPNWYANGRRRDILRERVERRLPVTRSAGRFVKSIIRPHGFDGY